jgi:hypothetical protein
MPTLAQVFEAHSKRISVMTQRRDAQLEAAVVQRDRVLRALPAAAKLYEAFDRQLAEARGTQQATDSRAGALRATALQEAADALATALQKAQHARREADAAAFDHRRQAEEAAEHEFIAALAAAASRPSAEPRRARAEKLARARTDFDAAIAAAQEQFRRSRDAALMAESRGSREADRAFASASRVAEVSTRTAQAAAEQALAKALSAMPEAEAALAEWRQTTARIVAEFKREEREAFDRFHKEVQALSG